MTKDVSRTRNWRHYNEALTQRGNIFFWFDEDCINGWHDTERTGKRGRPEKYSDLAIECGLTLRLVFNLTLRSAQGFIQGLVDRLKLPIKVPHYSLFCKRQNNLQVNLKKYHTKCKGPLHLVVDSTGLKIYGEGEWKVKIHGQGKRRIWRKVHLAVDSETQEIVHGVMTGAGRQDSQGFEDLISKIDKPIAFAIGDGAYDRFSCYELAAKRGFYMIAPPQINASLLSEKPKNKYKASAEAVSARDRAILDVRQLGRSRWKKAIGYHKRSLSETAMFRLKQLGPKFKARKYDFQSLEINIRCKILNKEAQLGFGF